MKTAIVVALTTALSLGALPFASAVHAQASGTSLMCTLERDCYATVPGGTVSIVWTYEYSGTQSYNVSECANSTECFALENTGCPPRINLQRMTVQAFDANRNLLGSASAPLSCSVNQ